MKWLTKVDENPYPLRVEIKFGCPAIGADNLLCCAKNQEEIAVIDLRLYYLCSAFVI